MTDSIDGSETTGVKLAGATMRGQEPSPKERPTQVPITRAEKTCWMMNDAMDPAHMVTMVAEADASAMTLLRERAKAVGERPPSFTALVIKAAAMTMQRHPQANRVILGFPCFKRLYQFHNQDISVAVEKDLPALPGQAFAAPIKNALNKSLADITRELRDLATCDEQTNQSYRLFMRILKYVPRPLSVWLINRPYRSPSLWQRHRGCACWVNAPSRSGADLVMTTWPWPITFSFGLVRKRPFVVGDRLEIRSTMPVVMVFDRRIMGGGPAGRIFADFKEILEAFAAV
jgi:pyruvate/2-oxoglutarate dehydrogenase complex dihydrolipoamide acyltransferase (E2) component